MHRIPNHFILLALQPCLAAVLLLGLSGVCAGETVKTIDLRSRRDAERNHFVVLCARESEPWGPGHAFVVWIEQLPDGRIIDAHGCGFYPPLEKGLLVVLLGDGIMANEANRAASVDPRLLTHRLICCVDREFYHRSLKAQEQWKKTQYSYNLFTRNCTHFTYKIATVIGVKPPRPKLGEHPADYLTRLMDR